MVANILKNGEWQVIIAGFSFSHVFKSLFIQLHKNNELFQFLSTQSWL